MSFKEGTRAYGKTTTLTISGSSNRTTAALDYGEVRLFNGDTATCYVNLGDNTVTATTSAFPLGPGAEIHMRCDPTYYLAVIGGANSNKLYISGCAR